MTVLYVHDLADHIIAELDTNGQTRREYIWLDDMPVAVVDGVASGTPTFYYVHVDHLNRPIRMTVQARTRAWEAKYAPFGKTTSIVVNPAVMDLRFPGQWFQLETGLAYNWHRHYDATIGRYIQPDPLGLDALKSDGPSAYAYSRSSPLHRDDPSGEGSLGSTLGGRVGGAIGVLGAETGPGVAASIAAGSIVGSIVGSAIEDSLKKEGPKCICSDWRKAELQKIVDSECKPYPPRCQSGDSCSSMASRKVTFTLCAEARKNINGECFPENADGGNGNDGHQIAYTNARIDAAICQGLIPSCSPP